MASTTCLRFDADMSVLDRLALRPQAYVLAVASAQAHKISASCCAPRRSAPGRAGAGAGRRHDGGGVRGAGTCATGQCALHRAQSAILRCARSTSRLMPRLSLADRGLGLPPLEAMLLGCPAVVAPLWRPAGSLWRGRALCRSRRSGRVGRGVSRDRLGRSRAAVAARAGNRPCTSHGTAPPSACLRSSPPCPGPRGDRGRTCARSSPMPCGGPAAPIWPASSRATRATCCSSSRSTRASAAGPAGARARDRSRDRNLRHPTIDGGYFAASRAARPQRPADR